MSASSAILLAVKDIGHQPQDIELREKLKKVESSRTLPPIFNNQLDNTAISRHFSSKPSKHAISEGRKENFLKLIDAHATTYIYCKNCGHKIKVTLRCKKWRTCDFCRWREAHRLKAKYLNIINKIPKERLRLITVTTVNKQKLDKKDIQEIRRYWIKLMHLKRYSQMITGGLYSIEAVNKGKGWNIHLHAIVEVEDKTMLPGSDKSKYEKHSKAEEQLSLDWKKVTNKSAFIVSILPAFSPGKGLNYILKYLSKSAETNGQSFWYLEALRNTRMLSAFGSWYSDKSYKPETFILVCPDCGHIHWINEAERELEWLENARSP